MKTLLYNMSLCFVSWKAISGTPDWSGLSLFLSLSCLCCVDFVASYWYVMAPILPGWRRWKTLGKLSGCETNCQQHYSKCTNFRLNLHSSCKIIIMSYMRSFVTKTPTCATCVKTLLAIFHACFKKLQLGFHWTVVQVVGSRLIASP